RRYLRGDQDKRKQETYAGTPSLSSVFVCTVFILTQQWPLAKFDVDKAFQQVTEDPSAGRVGVRIPTGLPSLPQQRPEKWASLYSLERWAWIYQKSLEMQPGQIRLLLKSHYGKRNAPNL